jgi:uncharacterized protein (TIGR02147 family)
MSTHAPLNLMLSGKRPIPKKYLPSFIKSLDLNAREGLYLETLIEFNQAKSMVEKDMYHARLKELAPSEPVNLVEMETFKFFGDPLHCIILDMTDLKDFSADPKWIQTRLQFKASLKQIEDTIARLICLKLLKDVNGRLTKTHKHITNRPDVADLGSQQYHKNVSQLAIDLISEQDVSLREFNGYSMNIKKNKISEAKLQIRAFVKDFIQKIEEPSTAGEETYQLNVQFFGVTKK